MKSFTEHGVRYIHSTPEKPLLPGYTRFKFAFRYLPAGYNFTAHVDVLGSHKDFAELILFWASIAPDKWQYWEPR